MQSADRAGRIIEPTGTIRFFCAFSGRMRVLCPKEGTPAGRRRTSLRLYVGRGLPVYWACGLNGRVGCTGRSITAKLASEQPLGRQNALPDLSGHILVVEEELLGILPALPQAD
jgi:hypothetical protein